MIYTQIDIDRSPEEVRTVFMAFSRYEEWKPSFIKSITPLTPKDSEMKPGMKIKNVLTGMTFTPTILENSAQEFKWRGSLWGLFNGEHSFRFEPTASGTTLIQSERFSGPLAFTMWSWLGGNSTKANFESFNRDLKARVEGSTS